MKLNIIHPTRTRTGDAPTFAYKPENLDPEQTIALKEFGRVKLRPIEIADERAMVKFHESLSEESIYLRYFEHISLDTRTLHERLARVCANTADSFAIVAEARGGGRQPTQILAVGRLTTTADPQEAGFALLVADCAHETGLPRELLKRLLVIARAYRFTSVAGELLVGDHDTLNLCRGLGFDLHTVPEDGVVRVHLAL